MLFLAIQTTDSTGLDVVDQATEKLSTWQRYWQSIDWDTVFSTFIQKGITLIIILVLFGIIKKAGNFLITRSFERQKRKVAGNTTRIETIHTLSANIFSYTLFFSFFIQS